VGHPRLSPRRAHARDAGQTARGSRTHLSQLDAIDDERGVLSVLLGGILELLDRDRGQRAVTEIPLPAIAPAPGGAIPEPTARLRALESATERLRARVVAALLLAATKAATATAAAKATAVLLLLSTSNNAVRATLPRLDRWTPRASERALLPPSATPRVGARLRGVCCSAYLAAAAEAPAAAEATATAEAAAAAAEAAAAAKVAPEAHGW
jgi:hypothetical protein